MNAANAKAPALGNLIRPKGKNKLACRVSSKAPRKNEWPDLIRGEAMLHVFRPDKHISAQALTRSIIGCKFLDHFRVSPYAKAQPKPRPHDSTMTAPALHPPRLDRIRQVSASRGKGPYFFDPVRNAADGQAIARLGNRNPRLNHQLLIARPNARAVNFAIAKLTHKRDKLHRCGRCAWRVPRIAADLRRRKRDNKRAVAHFPANFSQRLCDL
jgi:hypothetical protein